MLPRRFPIRVALALGLMASGALVFAAKGFPIGSYDSEGYNLTFATHGTFRVLKGDRLMVDGEYAVKGAEISLTDKSGIDACTGPDRNPGTYRWKLDGGALVFSTIHDPCNDRIRGLTGQRWKRKP